MSKLSLVVKICRVFGLGIEVDEEQSGLLHLFWTNVSYVVIQWVKQGFYMNCLLFFCFIFLVQSKEYYRGKYHCTIDLLFDWFGISCMTTDNFLFWFANQTNSKTVKQEVYSTVILSPLVFPVSSFCLYCQSLPFKLADQLPAFLISCIVCPWQAIPAQSSVCGQGHTPTLE